MSDTTETADRRLREDSPAVRAVCEQVEQIIGGPETDLAVDFAEIFLSRAPQELLQERSTLDLTHMVVGAYRFFAEARPDRVDVVVSNADPDGNGDRAPVTTVRTNVSERPFIVDTIREFLHSQQLLISQIVYPLFEIDRDEHGHMTAVRPPGDGASKESLVHCEVARVDDPERLDYIQRELSSRLQDVVRVTDDFGPMIERFPGRLKTESGKLELAPAALVKDWERVSTRLDESVEENQLLLIGRRHVRSDRKSTRLNSSHVVISYAVFCLKKKKAHV